MGCINYLYVHSCGQGETFLSYNRRSAMTDQEQFTAKRVTGESQATPSDYNCFGPLVFIADKCLICRQHAVCCFWPDHLLRRMSEIEETLECGV